MKSDPRLREQVVDTYGKSTTAVVGDVAEQFRVSRASVLRWKAGEGVFRPRGRKYHLQPTAQQIEILRLAESMSYSMIADRLGMTKQAVGKVVKRWRGWQAQPPSFAPGDVISFRGKAYTVLEAGPLAGTVQDANGRVQTLPWLFEGKYAQLLRRAKPSA
jgi:transposase